MIDRFQNSLRRWEETAEGVSSEQERLAVELRPFRHCGSSTKTAEREDAPFSAVSNTSADALNDRFFLEEVGRETFAPKSMPHWPGP
jgi:hypothetical protein